jgi:SAM-dependent methyltransferase
MTWTPSELETFKLNRLSWDERVEAHWQSAMYQRHVDDLRAGRPCVQDYVLEAVGDVAGLSLVHLQCHMGMETLSWAKLGADAVGLDFSQPAIDKANLLRDELKLNAEFVCANVYDAAETIGRTFDRVFISVGAICWLPDIERWARVVASLLKPGGQLYMNESHPFTDVFEDADKDANPQGIEVKYPYLNAGGIMFDEPGTYADPGARFKHTKSIDHLHTIGSVINALIAAGLVIDGLHESAHCMWPRFKTMTETTPDHWTLPGDGLDSLPHTYSVMAHKD